MTIKELKKILKGYPSETEILIRTYDYEGYPKDLPVREDYEITSSEQGGTFDSAIILEADLDADIELQLHL
jgi:hypothetical protein